MIAATSFIDRTPAITPSASRSGSCVKRHAFRLVGRLFVEIGCYLAFERIALESIWLSLFQACVC
jgi:hypothetical protein